MSDFCSYKFKSGLEAAESIKLLQQRKQKSEVNDVINNLATVSFSGKDDIAESVTHLLKQVKIPVSVSFLNASFASWGKKEAINVNFLREHLDTFGVFVIGSDLKISLRSGNIELNTKPSDCKYYFQLLQTVEKDLKKINLLQRNFQQLKISEVTYEDFLCKFSSNKYKMNLSFILRNSHALTMFSQGRKTYIKFKQDNDPVMHMSEKEVWEFFVEKGIESFLVTCLESLLVHFFKPINQGSLQICFNISSSILDKNFLNRHQQLFAGSGADGVILIRNSFDADNNSKAPIKNECHITETQSTISKPDCLKEQVTESLQRNDEAILESIKKSLNEQKSIIVLNNNLSNPLVFDLIDNDSPGQKLMVLQKMKNTIENQMRQISQEII